MIDKFQYYNVKVVREGQSGAVLETFDLKRVMARSQQEAREKSLRRIRMTMKRPCRLTVRHTEEAN